jgi:nicotinamide-nucleotide amidase
VDAIVFGVGTELLGGRLDTNGPAVARALAARGVAVVRREIVGDDRPAVAARLRAALDEVALVVVTGGLGPTDDDLTREALADATGRALREDETVRAGLEELARRRGRPAANAAQLRQALAPEGAVVLPNARGTAPGLRLVHARSVALLLPGPPGELLPMLDAALDGALAELALLGLDPPRPSGPTAVIRLAGIAESDAAQAMAGAPELDGLAVAWLAEPGDVSLHLGAPDRARLDAAVAACRARLGVSVCSTDGRTLPEVIVPVLAERFETVTFAESCTGGLVAAALTSVPGSSEVFAGSFVTYSDEAKAAVLGVPAGLLASAGAVSAEVAGAMAAGARRAGRADWAVAVTGVAGPGGGTTSVPVGRVHLGLAQPDGSVRTRTLLLPGDRDQVRRRAAVAALDLLRRRLLPAAAP